MTSQSIQRKSSQELEAEVRPSGLASWTCRPIRAKRLGVSHLIKKVRVRQVVAGFDNDGVPIMGLEHEIEGYSSQEACKQLTTVFGLKDLPEPQIVASRVGEVLWNQQALNFLKKSLHCMRCIHCFNLRSAHFCVPNCVPHLTITFAILNPKTIHSYKSLRLRLQVI